MLPKQNRLPKSRVQYILKKGSALFNKNFTVKFLPSENPETEESRFCVIVSKKIAAKAVPRNKLRRQIFEAIRLQKTALPTKKDIVIITKQATINLDFDGLRTEIANILKKI